MNEANESYMADKVDLSVYDGDDNMEWGRTVRVKYNLDIEYRSWGIKDITPVIVDDIEIVGWNQETGEETAITILSSDIDIEWVDADTYSPFELDVTLKDGKVDAAVMTFGYIKK